jgi:thiol-disulfide isomerase/thioredoxin
MNRRQFNTSLAALGLMPTAWREARAAAGVAALAGNTLEGQPYDLRADAGKVVLVFFWRTDCAVCRDKMPELRLNYAAWRDKGFQLVAVNTDKSLAAVHDYQAILDRTVPAGQRFPSLWRGDSAHRDSFGSVAHAPTSFVLDRRHSVVREIGGRIPAGLWDDIAELVLT